MESDPFALVEAMTIAGLRDRLRARLPLHPRRVPAGAASGCSNAIDEARARGLLGDDVMGHGLRFDIELARRRRVHLRRGDGAVQLDRGQARRAAQQAAVPGRRRAVRQADGRSTTSRRWSTCSTIVLDGRRGVRRDRHRAVDRHAAVLPVAATSSGPGCTRSPFGVDAARAARAGRRRRRRPTLQAVLLGGAAGVFVGPDELDMPLTFEGDARGRRDARLRRRHGVRRDASDLVDIAAADRRVLPRRVVRPVRALPGRHRPPGGGAAPPRAGAAAAASADELALLDEIGAGDARRVDLRPRPDGAPAPSSRRSQRLRPRSSREAAGMSRRPASTAPRATVELDDRRRDGARPGGLDDPRRLPRAGHRHPDALLPRDADAR